MFLFGALAALWAVNLLAAILDEQPVSVDARFVASAVYFAAACIVLMRVLEKRRVGEPDDEKWPPPPPRDKG
jgi:hypothetical protein